MLIRLDKNVYQCSKSIVIAGTVASGKTHFIKKMKKHHFNAAPEIDRSVVELSKVAPADKIIHWPIAEKMQDIDMQNVGAVILLAKNWDDYCGNIVKRGHLLQYSKLGLESVLTNWTDFFEKRQLPIMRVESNNHKMRDVMSWLLKTLNLVVPY